MLGERATQISGEKENDAISICWRALIAYRLSLATQFLLWGRGVQASLSVFIPLAESS
jgi:hypothetical protein